MNNISIILVQPQLGQNIGASARIMANFGFSDLRLVKPRTWPNQAAIKTASKAKAIIEQAKIYQDLKSAISDLQLVYATTIRNRDINKQVISSNQLGKELKEYKIQRLGIIFGPEASGLCNGDIQLANKIIQIPVGNDYSSLNLAQAVAIICYELANLLASYPLMINSFDIATHDQIDYLINFLKNKLQNKSFFKKMNNKEKMMNNIGDLIKRTPQLTNKDLKIIYKIINHIST